MRYIIRGGKVLVVRRGIQIITIFFKYYKHMFVSNKGLILISQKEKDDYIKQ